MPHLNELQEEFGKKGLTVIGVTGEPRSKTDTYVERTGMEFAYAFDNEKELAKWAGVRGIPHAMLIDPEGTVIWKGHPGSLSKGKIKDALKGAESGQPWMPVQELLDEGKFMDALTKAQEVARDAPEFAFVVDSVHATIKDRGERLKSAFERGDYLKAREMATNDAKAMGDMPQAAEAQRILDEIAKDKRIGELIEGLEEIAEILAKPNKKKARVKKNIGKLQDIADEYRGTVVEEQAKAAIERLRSKR